MNHFYVQPHPKPVPQISRQIETVQENIGRVYEILTKLYQFPDHTLNQAGFSERLKAFQRNLRDFEGFCELLNRSDSQGKIPPYQVFPEDENLGGSSDLTVMKKEVRRAKKLTNQLVASFCKIRLGINEFQEQGARLPEVTRLNQEIGSTVSDLLAVCNPDFE